MKPKLFVQIFSRKLVKFSHVRLLSIFFFLLFSAISLSAQEQGNYSRVDLGINGLAFALEMPLGRNLTVEPAVGFGPSYTFNTDADALTSKISWRWALLEPSFHASIYTKYFFNTNRRATMGKSLLFNSGSYLGVKIKYVSKSLSSPQLYSNAMILNLNFGGQYNIGKNWMWGYSCGLGVGDNLDNKAIVMYPAFDLKIGYVLPVWDKKKR